MTQPTSAEKAVKKAAVKLFEMAAEAQRMGLFGQVSVDIHYCNGKPSGIDTHVRNNERLPAAPKQP